MNLRTRKIAKRYGKLSAIKQLEKDLLSIRYCEKVEFNLNGFFDNANQVIIRPYHSIKYTDPQFLKKRSKFKLEVIRICASHKLIRNHDTITEYGYCCDIVFEGINGSWRTPVSSDQLPPLCFTVHPDNGELIKIVKGVDGYYTTCIQLKTKELNRRKADKLNADLGVTKRQVSAMVFGSSFGWDTPGADPRNYTVSGTPVFHPSLVR